MNNNIYVLEVDMDEHNTEEIAREAVRQIVELFDQLVEEQEKKLT